LSFNDEGIRILLLRRCRVNETADIKRRVEKQDDVLKFVETLLK
jgi:hypothetical protein